MSKRQFNNSDLSKKRRRVHAQRLRLFSFAGMLFLILILAIFRASIFRIHAVEVVGTKNISTDEVKSLVQSYLEGNYGFIIPKNNIFFYSKNRIESTLREKVPGIDTVEANASIQGTLSIEIQEKVQNAVWCKGEECYSMDYSGFVFEKGNVPEGGLVFRGLIEGDPIGKHFGEEHLVSTLEQLVRELNVLGFKVKEFEMIDKENAEAHMDTGLVLKFIPSEVDKKEFLAYLKTFIDNIKVQNQGTLPAFEYIDARYGNKIFYKIK